MAVRGHRDAGGPPPDPHSLTPVPPPGSDFEGASSGQTAEPAPEKVATPQRKEGVPRELATNPDYVEWDEPLQRRVSMPPSGAPPPAPVSSGAAAAEPVAVVRRPAPTVPPEPPPEPEVSSAAPAPDPVVGPPLMLETPPGVVHRAPLAHSLAPEPSPARQRNPEPEPLASGFRAVGSAQPAPLPSVGRAPPITPDHHAPVPMGTRVVATAEPSASRVRARPRPDRISTVELGVLALFALFLVAAFVGVWVVRSRTMEQQALSAPAAAAVSPPAPVAPPEELPATPAVAEPERPKVPVRTSLHNDPIDMLEERERAAKADATQGSAPP